jgi:hypothetical protein
VCVQINIKEREREREREGEREGERERERETNKRPTPQIFFFSKDSSREGLGPRDAPSATLMRSLVSL